MAARTVKGFFAALGLSIGYAAGLAFVAIAALKPVFPNSVGFYTRDGRFAGFGAFFPAPTGAEVHGGYWVIPLALALGLALLIATHKLARHLLRRERREWGSGELGFRRD